MPADKTSRLLGYSSAVNRSLLVAQPGFRHAALQRGVGNAGDVQEGEALAQGRPWWVSAALVPSWGIQSTLNLRCLCLVTLIPQMSRFLSCSSHLLLLQSYVPPIDVFTDFICRTRWALALSHQGPSAPQSHGKFVLWIEWFGLPCFLDQTCDPGNRWSVVGGTLK